MYPVQSLEYVVLAITLVLFDGSGLTSATFKALRSDTDTLFLKDDVSIILLAAALFDDILFIKLVVKTSLTSTLLSDIFNIFFKVPST